MKMKTVLLALLAITLVGCTDELFIIQGSGGGSSCATDTYCLDVSNTIHATTYNNLTTINDTLSSNGTVYERIDL